MEPESTARLDTSLRFVRADPSVVFLKSLDLFLGAEPDIDPSSSFTCFLISPLISTFKPLLPLDTPFLGVINPDLNKVVVQHIYTALTTATRCILPPLRSLLCLEWLTRLCSHTTTYLGEGHGRSCWTRTRV